MTDHTETAMIKNCCACKAELLDSDRFCRRCGASQGTAAIRAHSQTGAATVRLETDAYHLVSGSLIRAMTAGVRVQASGSLCGRFARRVILALVSIPIWLIIIFLSPLDAYLAARELSARVACERS
ncbi:MAG: hypothetical protein AB1631_14385 [Acidobacteriota bacterium]